jgi:hypothetical protein
VATRETFRNAGDAKNRTAGLSAKGSLRGKRSDPSHRANAPSSTVADPVARAETRIRNDRRVSTWFAPRRPQAPESSELRGLTR